MRIIALETAVYTERGHSVKRIKIGEVAELTDCAAIELTREGKALRVPDDADVTDIKIFIQTASMTRPEYNKFGKKQAKQMVKALWDSCDSIETHAI